MIDSGSADDKSEKCRAQGAVASVAVDGTAADARIKAVVTG